VDRVVEVLVGVNNKYMQIFETNTYKKLVGKPKTNSPEFLIIHHSGGSDSDPLADTSHHTAAMMEEWHLAKGWEGLGYAYVIHKNGDVWAGRPEHYHGAHTQGKNSNSIGICMSGNFDVTLPTKEQENSLRELLMSLMVKYKIPKEKIVPHRAFAKKSCYGKLLGDTWAHSLLTSDPIPSCDLSQFTLTELLIEVTARLKELSK